MHDPSQAYDSATTAALRAWGECGHAGQPPEDCMRAAVSAWLNATADDALAVEPARRYIDDALRQFRRLGISLIGYSGTGLVIREIGGRRSDIVRITTAGGIQMGLRALADALTNGAHDA